MTTPSLERPFGSGADGFQPCPITPVIEILFSRWTTPILWSLHHEGPLRFNEIRERLTGVTPKVLTQRLRQLERDGLITREQFPEVPPRVEYSITELGLSLSPAFGVLGSWADENLSLVAHARERYDGSGRPRPS
ncbi:helix-turn-helix domain-containing protein [Kineosporia mesophila]|uniref:Helix-turn-helix domain-containing protein n=1 Tax=Kineosporia mesophila TaxID=566012 RepID=A0ABP6ZGE0_9ACTN|nr:helix-turn-helix transcriptional regulator [Kineosporia mesophila]